MDKIDTDQIKKFYEDVKTVWPKDNKWHNVNQREICKYIHKLNLTKNLKILNAGSGGNNYNLNGIEMYHLDLAENKIKNLKNYFVGNVEEMPFNDNEFNIVLCVGSVLNYCDATKAIRELSRVLKKNGTMLLEFENSYSFEFKNTPAFKKNAAIVVTNYFNKPHKMWVYSLEYISKILQSHNMIIKNTYPYHILSSIAYHFINDENKVAKYSVLDAILRYIPIINHYSGNIILYCIKK